MEKSLKERIKELFELLESNDNRLDKLEAQMGSLDHRITLLEDESNLLIKEVGFFDEEEDVDDEEDEDLFFSVDEEKKDYGKN